MAQLELFKLLSTGLERTLRDMNPWWQGDPVPVVPPIRRWAYEPVLGGLRSQLSPAVVLRGPRQVGKSTLLAQVIDSLLSGGIAPKRIFCVQFDDLPELKRLASPMTELGHWYCDHILGKILSSIPHLDVAHFPERAAEREVDFVVTVGAQPEEPVFAHIVAAIRQRTA